ncbi:cysteine desulfurase [Weeksellaceae bacterium KMM 9724]|uniref:aminotransferase class V-fold PLP-dependent enzyme n=1 Tax=Profundicola chukchiensis TaxID=2961959 RepID=UPI002438FB69|nr:cysteine desulfurase [Profundicola chukchiensis]MDG4949326.1 cysteine desulfurase [Profundicola chukchiensis]
MKDVSHIRNQFPILECRVNGKPLVYLDNGATSQNPKSVNDAIVDYYTSINANVHRGIHTLSQEATDAMENSRKKIQAFINAKHDYEVIFTYGTTDSINLVARGLEGIIKKGDEIIISELEHHSNIVPWQMLCQKSGAILKYIPLKEDGTLDMQVYKNLLSDKTKLVSVNHVSNALGVVNPVEDIIAGAHAVGAWVLLDGAQAIPHKKVDVQALDADFYAFSGHKMYGPTGTGILYGKEEILNQLNPYRGGGEMIDTVSMEKSTYAGLPFKFEAGTPNIAGNIVLGKAVDFMNEIGIDFIYEHEQELIKYTREQLATIPEIVVYAKDAPGSGAVSFNIQREGVHSSDVGMILDKLGIAVRTGHHCCQPIMSKFEIPGTVRASFAVYNTKEEVDELIKGLKMAVQMLA